MTPDNIIFIGVLALGGVILMGALIGTGLIRIGGPGEEAQAREFSENRVTRFVQALEQGAFETASTHVELTDQPSHQVVEERLRSHPALGEAPRVALEGYERDGEQVAFTGTLQVDGRTEPVTIHLTGRRMTWWVVEMEIAGERVIGGP